METYYYGRQAVRPTAACVRDALVTSSDACQLTEAIFARAVAPSPGVYCSVHGAIIGSVPSRRLGSVACEPVKYSEFDSPR